MKLTIIGFWGGYPKKNEASSGYLLEHNGYRLLVDCGSGVLSKMSNFVEPEELDAVILSHYHPDHIADIGVLQHARLIQGFLGKSFGTLPIFGHHFNQPEFDKLTYKNITTGVAFNTAQAQSIGPFEVSFLRTNHPVECFAMRFAVDGKVVVYTADTSFKQELIDFSREADVLLCECNFFEGQNGEGAGHMTSIDAGTLAHQANVKQLILTHLPHYGELTKLEEEARTKYEGPISLASEGLTIEL
jgi:ribonuclease BN (tRNA processing enzyme)